MSQDMGGIHCSQCVKEGRSSSLSLGGAFTTAMFTHSWIDEDGRYHHHDPNGQSISFRCSNGHSGFISRERPCPAGDMGSDWRVSVHEYAVVVIASHAHQNWMPVYMSGGGWDSPLDHPGEYVEIWGPIEVFEVNVEKEAIRILDYERIKSRTLTVAGNSASYGPVQSADEQVSIL